MLRENQNVKIKEEGYFEIYHTLNLSKTNLIQLYSIIIVKSKPIFIEKELGIQYLGKYLFKRRFKNFKSSNSIQHQSELNFKQRAKHKEALVYGAKNAHNFSSTTRQFTSSYSICCNQ